MTLDRQLTSNEIAAFDNIPFRLGVGLQFPVETIEIPLGQWLANLYERATGGSFFSLAVTGGTSGSISSTSTTESLTLSSGLTPDPSPTSSSTSATSITTSIPVGSPQPVLTVSTATTDALTLDGAGLLTILGDIVLSQNPGGARNIKLKDVTTVNIDSCPLVLRSGKGGPADSTLAGGFGGNTAIYGGNGGDGSATHAAGGGGVVYVGGGSGGIDNGGNGGAGGSVSIDGGVGTGTANDGSVYIGSAHTHRVEIAGVTSILGFYGSAGVTQQDTGTAVTNNVTSGGLAGVIADFTDLAVYANDAATIRNNMYRIAEKLKKIDDALKALGIVL